MKDILDHCAHLERLSELFRLQIADCKKDLLIRDRQQVEESHVQRMVATVKKMRKDGKV